MSGIGVPLAIVAIGALLLWATRQVARETTEATSDTLPLLVMLSAATFVRDGAVAYVACAALALLHWHRARAVSRTAAVAFLVSAAAALTAALGLRAGWPVVAFLSSLLAIGVRVGLVPFHGGVAALCEKRASLHAQQLATVIGLVVAHLRFTDHIPFAYELAPAVVRYGAVMTLVPALMALVAKDLRAFYRHATVMHGGMMFAALGAASHGHGAAALMVVLTTAAAIGALGLTVIALEARVGAVAMAGPGGRIHNFPRLAAAFAIFGAAGVAAPGTAGFIADDLMLHALWEESVAGTVVMILGSAVLAVATLVAYSRIFLGRPAEALASDLGARERQAVAALVALLVLLGLTPGALLTPAEVFLRTAAESGLAP